MKNIVSLIIAAWFLLFSSYVTAFGEDPWYFEPNGLREVYNLLPKDYLSKEIRIVVVDVDKVKFFSTLTGKNYGNSKPNINDAHATAMASVIVGAENILKCKNCKYKEQRIKSQGVLRHPNAKIDSVDVKDYGNNIFGAIVNVLRKPKKKYKQVIIPIQDAQACEIFSISLSTPHYEDVKAK